MTTTAQERTRRTVRGYHEARFRGEVSAAAAHPGEPFRFQSPFITAEDRTGHLATLPALIMLCSTPRPGSR